MVGLLHPPQCEVQYPIPARSPLASLLGDSMQPNTLAQDTQGSLEVLTVELKCLPFFPPRMSQILEQNLLTTHQFIDYLEGDFQVNSGLKFPTSPCQAGVFWAPDFGDGSFTLGSTHPNVCAALQKAEIHAVR